MCNDIMSDFIPYPRTPHIAGSGLQYGDDAGAVVPFSAIGGARVVIEEKIDGANAAISFDGAGGRMLQSRGAVLSVDRNVWRERHFNYFKSWTELEADALLERLEDRYVVFGEWMGAAHSVFYDHLPHLFLEFDVWDRADKCFLSTPARRRLLTGLDIAPVPVLFDGAVENEAHLRSLVRESVFRTEGWRDSLRRACAMAGDDYAKRLARMFTLGTSEGVYLKVEDGDRTVARMKWVEPGFVQTILDADIHWQSTFMVPNLLGQPVPGLPPNLLRPGAVGGSYDPDDPATWAALKSRTAPS